MWDTSSEESERSRSPSPTVCVGNDGRGRGRGRGRGGQQRRGGSGSTRGRGGKRQVTETPVTPQSLLQKQKEEMKAEVHSMSIAALQSTLCRAIDVQPGIMIDVIQPSERHPGGHHPGPDSNVPDWCTCMKCREMPSLVERKCCGKNSCLSLHAKFDILILDEGVLALARLYRKDILVYVEDEDLRKANRHQAYRQFILWSHERLTTGDRRVIPSRIRDKFPDPFGQYKGFVASRF